MYQVGAHEMKEPEIWKVTKVTRKSALMSMATRPHWTVRASRLSKGSIRLCAGFLGKAG